jgi:hypothetical protein
MSYTYDADLKKFVDVFVVISIAIEAYIIVLEGTQVMDHNSDGVSLLVIILHTVFICLHYLVEAGEGRENSGLSAKWNMAANQVLTIAAFLGIYKGLVALCYLFQATRWITYMVQQTITDLVPFLFFFNIQMMFLAAIYALTCTHGETFLDGEEDYKGKRNRLAISYLKIADFTQNKNGYFFQSIAGEIVYVVGMLYLNIIILNLVIAVVGDV